MAKIEKENCMMFRHHGRMMCDHKCKDMKCPQRAKNDQESYTSWAWEPVLQESYRMITIDSRMGDMFSSFHAFNPYLMNEDE